jgi:hypothetical protein
LGTVIASVLQKSLEGLILVHPAIMLHAPTQAIVKQRRRLTEGGA